MKYETLKQLTKEENDFLLGGRYIAVAAEKTGTDREVFVAEIKAHIETTNGDKTKAAFFDFIVEICSLTFELYKWGLFLFHIENKMYGNWILAIWIEKELAIISKDSQFLRLENLSDKKLLFCVESDKKSALFELLLFLREKECVLEIISIDGGERIFDINYVSFDPERINLQEREIEIIREEFKKDKSRLESLQNIFVENIGAL